MCFVSNISFDDMLLCFIIQFEMKFGDQSAQVRDEAYIAAKKMDRQDELLNYSSRHGEVPLYIRF